MRLSTLLLVGGIGAGVLYFTMNPAHASNTGKPGGKRRFLQMIIDGKEPDYRLLDKQTAGFFSSKFPEPNWYGEEGRAHVEHLNVGSPVAGRPYGGEIAYALYQLEGRPAHLEEWASVFEEIGLVNAANLMLNKAHAIRQGG